MYKNVNTTLLNQCLSALKNVLHFSDNNFAQQSLGNNLPFTKMSTKYEWINAIVINENRQSISHVHHNICFSLFLLHLFRCVLFYGRSRHQCHCYQRKSINSFFKKVFFFYFSLIWNKNCSKCNSKTFHDLNLPQPSHPSTWLCRIEISEKKSLCIGLHKKRKHFTSLLFII